MQKLLKKRSRRSPGDGSPNDLPADLPPILKSNPIPEYVELWNLNKRLFWKQYWKDKKSGKLKFNSRRFTGHAGGGKWSEPIQPPGRCKSQSREKQGVL